MRKFRQNSLLAIIILADILIIEAIVWLFHMQDGRPLGAIISITTFTGYMVAYMEYKWKRDKEMAKIVAERLVRKPDIFSSAYQNWTNSQVAMNPSMGWNAQQHAKLLGGLLGDSAAGVGKGPIFGEKTLKIDNFDIYEP